jgi:large subunit ribosomal protein L17
MRHGDKNNNLSRTASHRKALLSNLTCQLFVHKKIVTTLAKAKALRPYVEPLITKAKENTTHQRRVVFSYLQDKEAIKELFDVISPKIASRPGGYTRVIKLGKRTGDNAEIAMIELVDYNEIYGKGIEAKEERTVKKTRRAGGARKKANKELSSIGKETDSTEKEIKPKENKKEISEENADTDNSNKPESIVAEEENEIASEPNDKPIGIETPEEDATK